MKPRLLTYQQRYYEQNKERIKAYQRNYYMRKKAGPQKPMISVRTGSFWLNLQ